MSTDARRTTLQDLPSDVLESMLVVQPPESLCQLACTNKTISNAINPRVWSAVSNRCLQVDAKSAKELRKAAEDLECRWWAASGALVRGVPVHFRRGAAFVALRSRSGSLIRIRYSEDDAVFAMDSSFLHGPPPALELDFVFAKDGPFPKDGMVARIEAALVPSECSRASPPNSPPRSPIYSYMSSRSPGRFEPRQIQTAVDESALTAKARITLNGELVGEHVLHEFCVFSTFDIKLPARLLHTKPRVNSLVIEYCGASSNAAYWAKSVRIVPAILPLPTPDANPETVPRRHATIARIPHHNANHSPSIGSNFIPKFRRFESPGEKAARAVSQFRAVGYAYNH